MSCQRSVLLQAILLKNTRNYKLTFGPYPSERAFKYFQKEVYLMICLYISAVAISWAWLGSAFLKRVPRSIKIPSKTKRYDGAAFMQGSYGYVKVMILSIRNHQFKKFPQNHDLHIYFDPIYIQLIMKCMCLKIFKFDCTNTHFNICKVRCYSLLQFFIFLDDSYFPCRCPMEIHQVLFRKMRKY